MHSRGLITVVLAGVVILFACSRSGGGTINDDGPHVPNPTDSTKPVITITLPAANQVYTSGDTILVQGRVTDNSLYRGSIRITNDAGGGLVKEQAYEIHGLQLYNFSIEHKTSVTSTSQYTVTVHFEDHGYNTETKQVSIMINP